MLNDLISDLLMIQVHRHKNETNIKGLISFLAIKGSNTICQQSHSCFSSLSKDIDYFCKLRFYKYLEHMKFIASFKVGNVYQVHSKSPFECPPSWGMTAPRSWDVTCYDHTLYIKTDKYGCPLKVKPKHLDSQLVINPASSMLVNVTWTKPKKSISTFCHFLFFSPMVMSQTFWIFKVNIYIKLFNLPNQRER